MPDERVAIVGGGAAGMLAAWLLDSEHHVTLFEAEDRLGGHVLTVPVRCGSETVYAEAGFKYFFDRGNPYLLAVFDELGLPVTWDEADMAIPHAAVDGPLVIPPSTGRQLARLLRAPSALADLVDLSLLRLAYDEVVVGGDTSLTVTQLLDRFPVRSHAFLYAFLCSSWGLPQATMARCPAYNILALLSSPGARYKRIGYLARGSSSYIRALAGALTRSTLRIGSSVTRVRPEPVGWSVTVGEKGPEMFDRVILALPPWRAAQIVDGRWRDALAAFGSFETPVAVHRDPTFMPADRADWCLSNTYAVDERWLLTSWEGKRQRQDVFRSWLADERTPRSVEAHARFEHLIVDRDSAERRGTVDVLQGRHGLHAVGMYLGTVDAHESCVQTAVRLAQRVAPTGRVRAIVANGAARARGDAAERVPPWRRVVSRAMRR
jgi:uncharacterized protein